MLDHREFEAHLRRETFVSFVECHAELTSTNDRALQLANGTAELPALVIADRQTAGRGRRDNRWWSADGALTFSLVAELPEGTIQREIVSLLTGLAVAETLTGHMPAQDVSLKWPNDVYVHGRKICGILTEIPNQRSDSVVIGVGINANNSRSNAPKDIRDTVTSLYDEIGTPISTQNLLCKVLAALEPQLAADPATLPQRWQRYCLLRDHHVTADTAAGAVSGVCRGIGSDGALILETRNGLVPVHSATTVRRTGMPPIT